MSDPLAFVSATPTLGLPMLIAGQAQKEFFVNQALSILDGLVTRTVIASQPAPPSDAAEGECYRVTAPAAQRWEGCEDHLAIRIGGDWHFIPPQDGMQVFDSNAAHILFFRSGWLAASPVAAPTGGSVVDLEARAAISQLIAALRDTGTFAA